MGICYIGGIRNNPQAASELLSLPNHVYPVFGMCIGYPAHDPDVKPRLPVEAVLKENSYGDDGEQVAAFNITMQSYYHAFNEHTVFKLLADSACIIFDSRRELSSVVKKVQSMRLSPRSSDHLIIYLIV